MTPVGRPDTHRSSTLILATASLLVSLLLAEAVVRLLLASYVDTALLQARIDANSIRALIQPSEDPELFYELRPNLHAQFQESEVFTSPTGYRQSGAVTEESPGDPVRVALIGDSSAFGYRVDYEDTYGEQFRLRIQKATGVPVDLRNYAVPGYNARQEHRIFTQRVLAYRPHLLILHHDHNDSQETGWGYPPNYIPPEYGDNALGSALLKLVTRQAKVLANRFALNRADDEHEYLDGYIISGPLYHQHLEGRRQLAEEARRNGIPAAAVIFKSVVKADPDYERGEEYLLLHKRLSESLHAMGFHVLDLFPIYQKEFAQRGWEDSRRWWVATEPIDAHPNPDGHSFIAESLLNFVLATPELAGIFDRDSGRTATVPSSATVEEVVDDAEGCHSLSDSACAPSRPGDLRRPN